MNELRKELISVEGGTIPITLRGDGKLYAVDIDGVEWFRVENRVHAVVLFQLLMEHVTEYVEYKLT